MDAQTKVAKRKSDAEREERKDESAAYSCKSKAGGRRNSRAEDTTKSKKC